MKKRRYIIGSMLLIAVFFCFIQVNRHFTSRDAAIDYYIAQQITDEAAQLIEIVETLVPDIYYLLLKTKGSTIINTVSCVTIKKTLVGWQVTASTIAPNVNLAKYMIDAETRQLK